MAENGYTVDIKLRNTEIHCDDEAKSKELFADVIKEFEKLGIPTANMIIARELHQECNLGYHHNQVLEQYPLEES